MTMSDAIAEDGKDRCEVTSTAALALHGLALARAPP